MHSTLKKLGENKFSKNIDDYYAGCMIDYNHVSPRFIFLSLYLQIIKKEKLAYLLTLFISTFGDFPNL